MKHFYRKRSETIPRVGGGRRRGRGGALAAERRPAGSDRRRSGAHRRQIQSPVRPVDDVAELDAALGARRAARVAHARHRGRRRLRRRGRRDDAGPVLVRRLEIVEGRAERRAAHELPVEKVLRVEARLADPRRPLVIRHRRRDVARLLVDRLGQSRFRRLDHGAGAKVFPDEDGRLVLGHPGRQLDRLLLLLARWRRRRRVHRLDGGAQPAAAARAAHARRRAHRVGARLPPALRARLERLHELPDVVLLDKRLFNYETTEEKSRRYHSEQHSSITSAFERAIPI